jgi:pyruvate carboxylase
MGAPGLIPDSRRLLPAAYVLPFQRPGCCGEIVIGSPIVLASSTLRFGSRIDVGGKRKWRPPLSKAVAGGGGRGMHRVTNPDALRAAIDAASREAQSAFGDPTVFLEQAVLNPRHVEVQILSDTRGNGIHPL